MDRSQNDINLFWLHVKFFSRIVGKEVVTPWPISTEGTTNLIRLSVPIRSQSPNSFALSLGLLRIRGELEVQPSNRPPVNSSDECKKARLVRLIKPLYLKFRSSANCLPDPGIGSTATDIAHRLIDLCISGLFVVMKQGRCSHQLA